jgi:hypothetical protein
VTLEQAATALQGRLGSRYEVTTHGSGTSKALVISRMVNEFGIAKKVATAIQAVPPGRAR